MEIFLKQKVTTLTDRHNKKTILYNNMTNLTNLLTLYIYLRIFVSYKINSNFFQNFFKNLKKHSSKVKNYRFK